MSSSLAHVAVLHEADVENDTGVVRLPEAFGLGERDGKYVVLSFVGARLGVTVTHGSSELPRLSRRRGGQVEARAARGKKDAARRGGGQNDNDNRHDSNASCSPQTNTDCSSCCKSTHAEQKRHNQHNFDKKLKM
jgi:hypothetical protein